MDRDEIERRDFPVARRGYDQGSVDEHLRRVADAMARAPAPSLSARTSEHVRAILEAAERSAADLRADAERRAGAHVAHVSEAADGMLSRLEALQGGLAGRMEARRAGGERIAAGLHELHAQVGAAGAPEEDFAAPAEPTAPAEEETAARITALNMALSGTPREETAGYVAEHYELPDLEALLDDVYAKVRG